MIIRPATPTDIPAIYSLILEFAAFQGTPGKVSITPAQMEEDKELFRCFVAEGADGVVVGFASYFPAYYSWSGKALYLDDLYVQPASRGGGTGKALLEAVMAQARAEGCRKVRWQVSGWNHNAHSFYRSIGATIDNTEWNCDLELY